MSFARMEEFFVLAADCGARIYQLMDIFTCWGEPEEWSDGMEERLKHLEHVKREIEKETL